MVKRKHIRKYAMRLRKHLLLEFARVERDPSLIALQSASKVAPIHFAFFGMKQ